MGKKRKTENYEEIASRERRNGGGALFLGKLALPARKQRERGDRE